MASSVPPERALPLRLQARGQGANLTPARGRGTGGPASSPPKYQAPAPLGQLPTYLKPLSANTPPTKALLAHAPHPKSLLPLPLPLPWQLKALHLAESCERLRRRLVGTGEKDGALREVTSPTCQGRNGGRPQAAEPEGPDEKRPLVSWALSPLHLELVPFSGRGRTSRRPAAPATRADRAAVWRPSKTLRAGWEPASCTASLGSCVPSGRVGLVLPLPQHLLSQLCSASSPGALNMAAWSEADTGPHALQGS